MRVGWVGTGVMGSAMCGHVLAAGHSVAVFNRTGTGEGRFCAEHGQDLVDQLNAAPEVT